MSSALNDISYELLEKALRKEQELGYQDSAVPGGLEKFVEEWWHPYKVMHPDLSKWRAGVSAALEDYRHSSVQERKYKIDLALGILRGRSISKGDSISHAGLELEPAPLAKRLWGSVATLERRTIINAAILISAAVIGLIAYDSLSIFFSPDVPNLPADISPTGAIQATPTLTASVACPQGCEEPPPGCVIKGNINTATGEKIYHVPSGKFYDATVISPRRGERWFCTEEEARANGWRKSDQ